MLIAFIVFIIFESRNSSGVSDESIQEMSVENWGGWKKKKVNVPKRRSVNSILSPHDPEYFQTGIILLKNEYQLSEIYTEHTCAFDSIYTIFCAAVLNHDKAKEQLPSIGPFLTFVHDVVKRPKSLTNLYDSRNEILFQIFSSDAYKESGNMNDTLPDNKKSIDCFTGLAGFFSQFGIARYIERGYCKSCKHERNIPYALVPLRTNIQNISLNKIEGKIGTFIVSRKCAKCKQSMRVTRELQTVIAFEVEPAVG